MKDGKNRQEQNKNKIPKNIALLYTTNSPIAYSLCIWLIAMALCWEMSQLVNRSPFNINTSRRSSNCQTGL